MKHAYAKFEREKKAPVGALMWATVYVVLAVACISFARNSELNATFFHYLAAP